MTENPRCFQAPAKVCGFIRPSVILSDVDDSHRPALANAMALSPLSLMPVAYLQPSHLIRPIVSTQVPPGNLENIKNIAWLWTRDWDELEQFGKVR